MRISRPVSRHTSPLAVVGVGLLLVLTALAPAASADAATTSLTLTLASGQSASGRAGTPVSFTATLRDDASQPIAGAAVALQRGPDWATASTGTTDAQGQVTLTVSRPAGSASWRASYAGAGTDHAASVSGPVATTGVVHDTTLGLTGPTRVVDERSVRLSFRWVADDSSPVAGSVVVYRRNGAGAWTPYTTLSTDAGGNASLAVTPRVDTSWRAVGAAGPWWNADASDVLSIDNLPSGVPAAYPAAAPTPTYTPPQARATGAGASPVVTRIPRSVWRSMVGRSWHRGCPVGRTALRLVRVNYWGFDGYRYRGEIVLRKGVAGRAARAFADMYTQQLPIRRMYRVDRFGWSKKLRGANDYRSMAADNTSGFNCRSVVNKPGVRSPHASGRAVDINTWENPYRSATGLVPNSWWATRSDPRYAWRSSSHAVVRIWRAHGFRWTYGTVDSQHYDGRGSTMLGAFLG